MTRQDFVENIDNWSDLMVVFDENGYDPEIIWCDDLDSYISDDLSECGWSWQDIRDALADIETGYDYYRQGDSFFSYIGVDNDFDDYFEEFLEWMDENDYWDDDTEDASAAEEDVEEDTEDEDIPTEDFENIMEVFSLSFQVLREAQKEEAANQTESARDLEKLMGVPCSPNNIIRP